MTNSFSTWYEAHYHNLTGSGVWLRGNEPNTKDSSSFECSSLNVLISRLSTSWDVIDSYTHKILYEIITGVEGVYADFSFLPPPRDAEMMTESSVPWLLGSSSKMAGGAFDVVAFSNSIVQELINVPIMLEKSGIPLRKKDRNGRNDLPLILLGGANALFTSALLGENSFVDGIFTGESGSVIAKLFTIIRNCKKRGVSREETLQELESVPGFFRPESSKTTVKQSATPLEKSNLPSCPPVVLIGDQPARAQIPISEGCPCFCSFCAESWSRKPYREFTTDEVKQSAAAMKVSLGAEEVELYSFNFSMHSSFYRILQDMVTLFPSVKVSSQRFDHIADDPSLLQYLHAIGKSTFTCGLEGISARLRRYLHKSLDEQKLRSSLSILMRSPVRELKIFLIATGLETSEDFDEFREFLSNLIQLMQSAGRRPRIVFSMTPLVRFPFTPLESEDAPEPSIYHEIIHQTERLVRCRGMEFRISADLNDYLLSQILVRAQYPDVLDTFYEVSRSSGFVYYREIPELYMPKVLQLLTDKQFPLKTLLSGWDRKVYQGVPVQTEVDQTFLEESKVCASGFEDRGYCLGSLHHEAECKGCGACKDSESINRLISRRDRDAPSIDKFRKTIKEYTTNVYSCNFFVTIERKQRGIPRNVIASVIAGAIMRVEPAFIPLYRKYNCSHVENFFGSPWITGDDILTFSFSPEAEALFVERPELLANVNKTIVDYCRVAAIEPLDVTYDYQLISDSSYKVNPSLYCAENQLKYTHFKISDGSYRFEFTPQSLKKQDLLSLVVENAAEEAQITIKPGMKFKFDRFLECAFILPSVQSKTRIKSILTLSRKKQVY